MQVLYLAATVVLYLLVGLWLYIYTDAIAGRTPERKMRRLMARLSRALHLGRKNLSFI